MRFNNLLFCLVLGLFPSCSGNFDAEPKAKEAQEQTPGLAVLQDALNLEPSEGLVYFNKELFTGEGLSYYPNGQPFSSTIYLDGKKHGLYKKWFPDSKLSFESNYIAGKQDGLTRSWWSSGNLRSELNFKAGVGHGQQLQWYKSGVLFKSQHLIEGKEEGMQQAWRENGKIYNNYEARNGRIYGLKRSGLCYKLEDENIQYAERN